MPSRSSFQQVQAVRAWVERTTGRFTAQDVGKECGIDPETRNSILIELVRNRVIEPVTDRNGVYQKFDRNCPLMDWQNADEKPYDIWLPLGLHNMCYVPCGSVVLIAGETNAGKTGFVLKTIFENLLKGHEVDYFNNEMSNGELRGRLMRIASSVDAWKGLRPYKRVEDFHAVVNPNGLNVIDYLQIYNDFALIGEKISRIHAALENGIAIICIQKKKNEEYGRGGEFTAERARLALALGYDKETQTRRCRVTKCKMPVDFRNNPDGKECMFTFDKHDILQMNEWSYPVKQNKKIAPSGL